MKSLPPSFVFVAALQMFAVAFSFVACVAIIQGNPQAFCLDVMLSVGCLLIASDEDK